MLDTHEVGAGRTAFRPRKRGDAPQGAGGACTSHFLLSDATSNLTSVEGNLGCPKCGARIGSFDWSGMQCSCGTWVSPAIQVVKSKVDESFPLPQARVVRG